MAKQKDEEFSSDIETKLAILRENLLNNKRVATATGTRKNVQMINNPEQTQEFLGILDELSNEGATNCPSGHGLRLDPTVVDFNALYNAVFNPEANIDNNENPIYNGSKTRTSADVSGVNSALTELGYTSKRLGVVRNSGHKFLKYYANYIEVVK